MINKEKILNLLGLAMRAGKIASGEQSVLQAIRNQETAYVFVGEDASDNTKKTFENKTNYYDIPLSFDFNTNELSQAIGRQRTILALLDKGFADSVEKLINE